MDKIKILIACHKPCEVYHDNVYTPIHVGRSISTCTDEMSWMIGDDTGDSISEKNGLYCELTAQYWAWKNLKDVEYIGLCHYRRFFSKRIDEKNIDMILGKKYDAICVSPLHEKISTGYRLAWATTLEDYHIFMYCFKRIHPESFEYAKCFLQQGIVVPYNMFVMKKKLFDEFAKWQFDILFEMEKYVRLTNYTRLRRLYGYYSEMLLPIYLYSKKLKVRYEDVSNKIGGPVNKPRFNSLRNTIRDLIQKYANTGICIDIEAVLVGFKSDSIDINRIEDHV